MIGMKILHDTDQNPKLEEYKGQVENGLEESSAYM